MRETAHRWAEAVREQDEKLRVLHEARMQAHDEMKQAIAAHEFQVRAYDSALTRRSEFKGLLSMAVEREAYSLIAPKDGVSP